MFVKARAIRRCSCALLVRYHESSRQFPQPESCSGDSSKCSLWILQTCKTPSICRDLLYILCDLTNVFLVVHAAVQYRVRLRSHPIVYSYSVAFACSPSPFDRLTHIVLFPYVPPSLCRTAVVGATTLRLARRSTVSFFLLLIILTLLIHRLSEFPDPVASPAPQFSGFHARNPHAHPFPSLALSSNPSSHSVNFPGNGDSCRTCKGRLPRRQTILYWIRCRKQRYIHSPSHSHHLAHGLLVPLGPTAIPLLDSVNVLLHEHSCRMLKLLVSRCQTMLYWIRSRAYRSTHSPSHFHHLAHGLLVRLGPTAVLGKADLAKHPTLDPSGSDCLSLSSLPFSRTSRLQSHNDRSSCSATSSPSTSRTSRRICMKRIVLTHSPSCKHRITPAWVIALVMSGWTGRCSVLRV